MSEANKMLMKRFITEYQTERDEQVLWDTVSERMVNRTPMTPTPQGGPAEVKEIFDAFHAAFEGFSAEILQQAAEGDRVWTYKAFSGTHVGDFHGIPATGRPVRFEVMDIVRIADGKIVEHWGLVDQLALLRQLGVVE
jgi:predicted ester cyclase